MSTWLKMIGTTGKPCPEPYTKNYVGFPRRPRHIHSGDHMILYAVGGRKRVFAIAEVTSEVYKAGGNAGENARWPYRVDINYLVNMPASDGVHIKEVSTPERELLRSVRRQSYLRLRPEEYKRATTKLQKRL